MVHPFAAAKLRELLDFLLHILQLHVVRDSVTCVRPRTTIAFVRVARRTEWMRGTPSLAMPKMKFFW